MAQRSRKVVVIGAGIAGLCTAVHACRCGYEVELVEAHDNAGGLATSWRRGEYTFETCLHWLVGSRPGGTLHAQWQEVFDVDRLTFVDTEEFMRMETEHGELLRIYANVDRLEAELLKKAPEDAEEIKRLTAAVRRFARLQVPDPSDSWLRRTIALLRTLPYLPALRHWSSFSIEEYGKRFKNKLLRGFFGEGETAKLAAFLLVMSLAWMSERNAGYVIGGSQAIIRLIRARLEQLGAHLRFGAKVERIVIEGGAATGVQLADGETIAADWVISAADRHATIHEMLGGKYVDARTEGLFDRLQPFPSYLQVSLGVARDLSQYGGYVGRILDTPITVDPETQLRQVAFRLFHYDPTLAPRGKTAVTCFLPTRNFAYWTDLRTDDSARYSAEKRRVEEAVITVLEKMVPDIRNSIEVVDVATPATVIRYTNNWKGSMEGWLLTPGMQYRPLPNTLPRLRRFMMVGQWVMSGGGLPSGLLTARHAVRAMCKHDGVPFIEGQIPAAAAHLRGGPTSAGAASEPSGKLSSTMSLPSGALRAVACRRATSCSATISSPRRHIGSSTRASRSLDAKVWAIVCNRATGPRIWHASHQQITTLMAIAISARTRAPPPYLHGGLTVGSGGKAGQLIDFHGGSSVE